MPWIHGNLFHRHHDNVDLDGESLICVFTWIWLIFIYTWAGEHCCFKEMKLKLM